MYIQIGIYIQLHKNGNDSVARAEAGTHFCAHAGIYFCLVGIYLCVDVHMYVYLCVNVCVCTMHIHVYITSSTSVHMCIDLQYIIHRPYPSYKDHV